MKKCQFTCSPVIVANLHSVLHKLNTSAGNRPSDGLIEFLYYDQGETVSRAILVALLLSRPTYLASPDLTGT